MGRNLLSFLVFTSVLIAGCHKKKPVTVAEAPPPRQATSADLQATAPVASEPDPWSADLATLTAWLRDQGLLRPVYFDFDKADLKAEAREILAANARLLREHGDLVVTVEGHCDERDTADYNLALGDRRAHAVRRYLESLGVDGEQLVPVSYGEERPVCWDSREECWWQNRRGDFVVTARR